MKQNRKRKRKLVLKIAANTWENASRDIRELSVVQELGADVLVMAKGDKSGIQEKVRGFSVYRMSTRPLGKYFPKGINRIVSVFTWAYQVKKIKPDVISGHNLVPLFIGWLSFCFQKEKNRPKLVYDSHEFTIYDGEKTRLQMFFTKCLEGFLIRKCAFTIEVNDLIADEVQRIHKLNIRPVVVRNIPEKWEVDPVVCQEVRKQIMSSFEGGGKEYFLLMYHGGVMPDRGIERLIYLVSINPELAAIILGDGEEPYIKSLKKRVQKLLVSDRICFYRAVPQTELWKYVGAADLGMILASSIKRNYLYSLPNKFFENIQSETPVVCPNYPAMKQIIKHFGNGVVCNPIKLSEINHCVEQLRTNPKLYQKYKTNTKIAKEILCWENEKKILKKAYAELLG